MSPSWNFFYPLPEVEISDALSFPQTEIHWHPSPQFKSNLPSPKIEYQPYHPYTKIKMSDPPPTNLNYVSIPLIPLTLNRLGAYEPP